MWFLALRQMAARKKQTSLVTGGILLGTTAYITFSGVMLGFQDYMSERLVNGGGHIRVSAREKEITAEEVAPTLYPEGPLIHWIKAPSGRRDYARIDHPAGWFDRLDADPSVVGYSPELTVQGLAKRGTLSISVNVIGVEPTRRQEVTNINDYIQGGTLADIGHTGNRIIVGKGVLSKLGSALGETIVLSNANGNALSFRIINKFEIGVPITDDSTIYASLSDVQKLNRTPSQISDLLIRLTDVGAAQETSERFAVYSTDKVESWEEANQGILSVFKMQDMIRNLMSACILLVAGFGIYNVLSMIVSQKRKEIGILRSMGYTGTEVSRLFLYQGLLFGTAGGFLGLVAGYLACHYISTLHIGVPGSVAYRNMFVSYRASIYVRAFFLALGASIFAGWIPARSAGKMNPIDIIRTEGA
jgi:lipoprotein-releasing system permease protein